MAKQEKALVGTLNINQRGALVAYSGTLVDQNENFVVVDVKRPRTSKHDRHLIAMADVQEMHATDDVVHVYTLGETVESYGGVTLIEIVNGMFSGSYTDNKGNEVALLVAEGRYTFIVDEEAEEEEPKAKAGGKGKKQPEPEPEEEEEEEKPKGKAGAKGKKQPEPEPEEEEEEFEPEEGSYVLVTDADGDEYEGTVTELTAKKIVIQDVDGESLTFMLSKVTVAEAEAPEEEEEEEEKPKGKAGAKGKAKQAEPEPEEEEEEEEKPKGKAGAKGKGAPASKAKQEEEDDGWDE